VLPGGSEACVLGLCCPSVLYGLAVEKLARPHECVVGGTFLGACLVHASCGICATFIARGAFREKYGIKGDCCTDCLIAYFCDCCAVIQMYNHIYSEQQRRQYPVPTNPGFGIPNGVVAPSPEYVVLANPDPIYVATPVAVPAVNYPTDQQSNSMYRAQPTCSASAECDDCGQIRTGMYPPPYSPT